jgi:tripartite-type tricarboxylate transporter receptor subunit TctC
VIYRNRLPEAPNAPIADELFPGLSAITIPFNAIVVPSGVPPAIKAQIAAGMKAAIESKSYKERILAIGSYPHFTTPEETDAFLKKEIDTWNEVAKAANIHAD